MAFDRIAATLNVEGIATRTPGEAVAWIPNQPNSETCRQLRFQNSKIGKMLFSRGPYLLRLNEHANRRNRCRPVALVSDESKPHHVRRNPHMTAQIRPDSSTKSDGRCTCRCADTQARNRSRTRSPTIRHPNVCKRHDTRGLFLLLPAHRRNA